MQTNRNSNSMLERLVNSETLESDLADLLMKHTACFSTENSCADCHAVLVETGKEPIFLLAANPKLSASDQKSLLLLAQHHRSSLQSDLGYQPTQKELAVHGLLTNPNVFQSWESHYMPDFLMQSTVDLFSAFQYLKNEVLVDARRNGLGMSALVNLLISSQGEKWVMPPDWYDRDFRLAPDFIFEVNAETLSEQGSRKMKSRVAVMVWMAIGDALGAPHEFYPPLPEDFPLEMSGGNGWAPGEWTDDTAMAIAILKAWQRCGEFGSRASMDTLVELWRDWAVSAKDVGIQTKQVLSSSETPTASASWKAAETHHRRHGKSAGNGSLMRTAPLAFLDVSDEELTRIVRAVSMLTHYEIDASDACVIWTHAIRLNLQGKFLDDPISQAVAQVSESRQSLWHSRIEQARARQPRDFENNGWVVSAFQAAVSAINGSEHDPLKAVERAVRAGYDTDTVAAITGAYMGSTIMGPEYPTEWIPLLHGWPNINAQGLATLASSV